MTSGEHPTQLWTESMKEVPTEVKVTFLGTNHRGSPDVQVTVTSSLASWVYAQIVAGHVGSEDIGEHGVAGLLSGSHGQGYVASL